MSANVRGGSKARPSINEEKRPHGLSQTRDNLPSKTILKAPTTTKPNSGQTNGIHHLDLYTARGNCLSNGVRSVSHPAKLLPCLQLSECARPPVDKTQGQYPNCSQSLFNPSHLHQMHMARVLRPSVFASTIDLTKEWTGDTASFGQWHSGHVRFPNRTGPQNSQNNILFFFWTPPTPIHTYTNLQVLRKCQKPN